MSRGAGFSALAQPVDARPKQSSLPVASDLSGSIGSLSSSFCDFPVTSGWHRYGHIIRIEGAWLQSKRLPLHKQRNCWNTFSHASNHDVWSGLKRTNWGFV